MLDLIIKAIDLRIKENNGQYNQIILKLIKRKLTSHQKALDKKKASIKNPIDISQEKLNLAFRNYLDYKKDNPDKNISVDSKGNPILNDQGGFIIIPIDHLAINALKKKLEKGYCSGIGGIWALLMLMTEQENLMSDKNVYWYYATALTVIYSPPKNLTLQDKMDVELLLSLIESAQHLLKYFWLPQIRLDMIWANESNDISPPQPVLHNEFSISALWNKTQFETLLKEIKLADQKFMRINSHGHAIYVFKQKEKFIFFNPNDKEGGKEVKTESELASKIFPQNTVKENLSSPLSINIFGVGKQGDSPVISELLTKMQPIEQYDEKYSDGFSGLMMAAKNGSIESLRYYLQKYKDTNSPYDFNHASKTNGSTALSLAVLNGHLDIVIELLKYANVNVNKTNKSGFTPLDIAVRNHHFDVAIELIRKKANINTPHGADASLLFTAARDGNLKLMQALIKAKANVNQVNNSGATPFFMAVQFGHLAIVEELLNAKANINTPTKTNVTPLFIAAQKGFTNIVKKLLDAKADVNFPFNSTEESLIIFAKKNKVESKMAEFLERKRMGLQDLSKEVKMTPLEIAEVMGHQEIVKMLRESLSEKTKKRKREEESETSKYKHLQKKSKNGEQEVISMEWENSMKLPFFAIENNLSENNREKHLGAETLKKTG